MKRKGTVSVPPKACLEDSLKRAYERLRRANKKLKQLDREKSEFIAVASHRLRNPLACIRWCLELLLSPDMEKGMSSKHKSFLREIYKSNQILIDLADNLLRVCRIEGGKTEISAKPIALDALIGKAIKKLSAKIENKGVKVVINKPGKELPKINADSEKIGRALMNILDNAVVYNYVGGLIDISLETVFRKRGGKRKKYVKCEIFNTGVGIPEDQLENIFTKFFRARNVITVHTEGNGLDMFVAKSYMESHGGKIWAESKGEEKGVTIGFMLPVGK